MAQEQCPGRSVLLYLLLEAQEASTIGESEDKAPVSCRELPSMIRTSIHLSLLGVRWVKARVVKSKTR